MMQRGSIWAVRFASDVANAATDDASRASDFLAFAVDARTSVSHRKLF